MRLAVVSGLGNARRLVAAMDRGEVAYDIVEVMACPGGCAGGGGQPLPNDARPSARRVRKGLHTADRRQQIRLAQDNVLIKELYREWLERPNSEVAHHVLHTTYGHRRRITEVETTPDAKAAPAVCVKVCVGTSCYLRGARDVLRRFSEEVDDQWPGRAGRPGRGLLPRAVRPGPERGRQRSRVSWGPCR